MSRSQENDWRRAPAYLLLLSRFCEGDSPTRYRDADYWKTAFGEEPTKVIEQFINDRVLEPAGLPKLMAYKYKVSDLKRMLKENQLKVTGPKEELVKRLIDNNAIAMYEATKDIELYQCTAEGTQLAQNYLAIEKTKRESAEREVFALLTREEYSKAVHVVAQYEASQVFPREPDVECLKWIFNSVPAILQYVEKDQLKHLRLATVMMQLWGTKTAQQWLPNNLDTGNRLDAEVACRMFVFYGYHQRNIEGYKEAGVRTVKVLAVEDGTTCSECRKIDGKKYRLEDLPELPYAKCTSELGCRCTTVSGKETYV